MDPNPVLDVGAYSAASGHSFRRKSAGSSEYQVLRDIPCCFCQERKRRCRWGQATETRYFIFLVEIRENSLTSGAKWVTSILYYDCPTGYKEMLHFYSGHLNTVEINNTFYRKSKESVLTSWAEQVPGDFVSALKASQVITHLKRLRNVSEETEYLLRTLSVLDRRLGPVLFQFPKSFRADLPALEDFLGLIPSDREPQ